MKKVLMVGAAIGAMMVGAVAMAQGDGASAPDGTRIEQARWGHDGERGHRGHHRWGRHHDERGWGRRGGRGGRGGMERGARLEQMFDEADVDGDGALTQEEIDGFKANRFAAMDANADGKVAADELVAYRMMQRAKRQISRMDQDGDGLLSIDELPDRTPPFARFDLDQNGSVTKAELELARETMRGMRGDRRGMRGMDDDGPRGMGRGPRPPMGDDQDQ